MPIGNCSRLNAAVIQMEGLHVGAMTWSVLCTRWCSWEQLQPPESFRKFTPTIFKVRGVQRYFETYRTEHFLDFEWTVLRADRTLKKRETNSIESDLFVLKGYMNVKICLLFLRA